ncbi:MAG: DinB family protein [Chloroflexota bacterium]
MTDTTTLRASLIDDLRACRDAERAIFGALDPTTRDTPGPDGGWSPKDNLAHLSAWRHRQATKMAAIHDGLPAPTLPAEDIDATNAVFHAERASWSWDEVDRDADATLEAFVAQIAAVSDEVLLDEKVLAPIMGDGPEHDLAHLGAIAKTVGMSDRVRALADRTQAMLDDGVWPDRAAAVARYNLACHAALDGDLDRARGLLRLALPGHDDLIELAPKDSDLIALRDEIPALAVGT